MVTVLLTWEDYEHQWTKPIEHPPLTLALPPSVTQWLGRVCDADES
jgi:hypothetical protein